MEIECPTCGSAETSVLVWRSVDAMNAGRLPDYVGCTREGCDMVPVRAE